jgi:hypothetical protein
MESMGMVSLEKDLNRKKKLLAVAFENGTIYSAQFANPYGNGNGSLTRPVEPLG